MKFDFFGAMTGLMDETGADYVQITITKDNTTFTSQIYREEEPKLFTKTGDKADGMRS